MKMGTVAQWAGAIATFLAVLVALFKDSFIKWWYRPKLEVTAKLEEPHCQMTSVYYDVQRVAPTRVVAKCYYLRIWIENSGKTRAERVQVFAAKLLRRAADGEFRTDLKFLPMNLLWTHYEGPGGAREIYAEGISPEMGKHCELGRIIDPTDPLVRKELGENLPEVPSTSTIFALDLEVHPSTLCHLLAPGTYRLKLRIAAANCRPITRVLEFTLTGDWFDDPQKMFRDGIGMRILPYKAV